MYKANTSLLSEESSRQCMASLIIKSFININLSLGMYQGIPKESQSVRRFKLTLLKSMYFPHCSALVEKNEQSFIAGIHKNEGPNVCSDPQLAQVSITDQNAEFPESHKVSL